MSFYLASHLDSKRKLLSEQAMAKWLKHGDRNTHFFHGIRARNSIKRGIHHLNIIGDLCPDLALIKDHVIDF